MNVLQDIAIGILLLFGLISGFVSGGIKKGIRLLVTLGIFFGIFYGFKDLAVDFLRYDLLSLVTNGQGLTVQVDPTLTVSVINFEDLFILLQNADENLTGAQLKATCEVFFTVITFFGILLATELVSFPISFVLYHCFFKFIFFRVGKKPKFFGRLIGGILGIVEVLIFTYLWGISFGQLGALFNEVILIVEAIPAESRGSLNQILDISKQFVEALDYENSIILSGIINTLASSGIDPFAFVSITVEGSEEKLTLPKAIQGIHDVAYDSIVKFLEQMFSNSGNNATPPESGEAVAKLYNFGFNF